MSYLGKEVFDHVYSSKKLPNIQVINQAYTFDKPYARRGKIILNDPFRNFEYTYVHLNKSERKTFIEFFESMQGKKEGFWLPSGKSDFVLTTPNVGTSLYVKNSEYKSFFPEVNNYNIKFGSGYDLYTNIVSVSSVDTDRELLIVGDVPESGMALTTQISLLYYVRFDIDSLEFRWISRSATTCTIKFRSIIGETPS